jgi:group I intron endonuclease
MAFIYKITNKVNGKCYIGFTNKTLIARFRKHVNSSTSGSNVILHKAIRKYGRENFTIEVLEKSEDEKFLLEERESFYIQKYNTLENGYNMTLGGQGCIGFQHSEEARKTISEQYKERWKDPEFIEKQKSNPRMTGKKHSEETRKKMRNKNYKHTDETKEFLAEYFSESWLITMPCGEKKIIKNLREFCRENNYNRSHLYQVAKGKLKSYKGIKCEKL